MPLMAGSPPTPPYDPMTPSLADYQNAQRENALAAQHYTYVTKQSNDKGEIARAKAAMESAAKKRGAIANARLKAKAGAK